MPSEATRKALTDGLMRWAFFGVLLALFPLAASGFHVVTRADKQFSLQSLVERGELLLVSSAVLGAALAEMLAQPKPRFQKSRLFIGLCAGTVILAASAAFADVSAGLQES